MVQSLRLQRRTFFLKNVRHVIFSLLLSVFFLTTSFAQPAGWSYLNNVLIQENSGSELTDYQVSLQVNTQALVLASKMNVDGSDIRFSSDSAGTQMLNYWIESGMNTATTKIWVLVDDIPASGTKVIYFIYGNPSASVGSTLATFNGPNSSTDSVLGGSAGGVNNSQRGFRFSTTEDLLVTAFGKNEPNGSVRTLTLFNFLTQAIISQQSVGGPAGQYSYQDLPTALWLNTGTQYLIEIFQGATDGYYFGAAPQVGQHLTYYDMRYCNGCTQNTFPQNSLGGMHYGYPDFLYYTRAHASVEPTVSLSYVITATAGDQGTISPQGNVDVAEGSNPVFTFTPDNHYHVSAVYVDGGLVGTPSEYQFIGIAGDHTVHVDFMIDNFYRTAKYEDWATSVNAKGKRTAAKRKADNVAFKFTLTADTARPFKLDFGMKVKGVLTRGTGKVETLAVFNNVKKYMDTLLTVAPGDVFQVDGIGESGKKIAVKYSWGKKKAVAMKADSSYLLNKTGLPMPNLVNIGEELFPKGFNQPSIYFANGLIVGVPQGLKKGNSVKLSKYAEVLATLAKPVKTGFILDTINILCLDSLGKGLFSKQQKALSPTKYNNVLLGQLIALKLNIGASATQKFPVGLGEMTFDDAGDPANPFNGSMVSTISSYADSMISCLVLQDKPTATLSELYTAIVKINGAFANTPYTIDTLNFGTKTQLKGLYTVAEVPYMHVTPGVSPKAVFTPEVVEENMPEEFALYQNYPNPFNPVTHLSFVIGHSSLVTLKVYDVLGQEVAVLLNSELIDEGERGVEFDASSLSSGVYFYRLTATSVDEDGGSKMFTDMKRMILIK